jgi:hypothetical protein
MRNDELLQVLTALEVELHQGATRADRARMEALLHSDFFEIGRSGTLWTRAATLDEFSTVGGDAAPRIRADRFELRQLSDDLALLTYRSAHVGADDSAHRFTLRSSLWQRGGAAGWQLRFHQGTPTEDSSS